MHLDSADKQAISRGSSGFDPCKTLLLLGPSTERGSKQVFVMHVGLALHDFRGLDLETPVLPAPGCHLFDGFHLCVCNWGVCGRAKKGTCDA
jgi:hypothetical protein